MTAADILAGAETASVRLTRTSDRLHYDGPAETVANLLPELRQYKPELLALLSCRDNHEKLPTGRRPACGHVAWWRDGDTWRCQRCYPPPEPYYRLELTGAATMTR